MSSRFEEAPEWVYEMVNEVRKDKFQSLGSAAIKVLYDTKKRKSGGNYVIGRMQKANDLVKRLTADDVESPEGVDYIMYLDKAVFENIEDIDRQRIIQHELFHCDVNLDADNPYKLRGHEIETFYDEIEANKDDPRWKERCVTIASSIYDED